MDDWGTCKHSFYRYFGPALQCKYCGAQTMVTMDKIESKLIYPPIKIDFEEPVTDIVESEK